MNIFERIWAEVELIRFAALAKKEWAWYRKNHPDWDMVAVGVPCDLSENAKKLLFEKTKKKNRRNPK